MIKNTIDIRNKVKDSMLSAKVPSDTHGRVGYFFKKTGYTLKGLPHRDSYDGISGMIVFKLKTIFINHKLPTGEKIFALAHETAHALFHSEQGRSSSIHYLKQRTKNTPIETAASKYAYELCFPHENFVESYRENQGDVKKIASHFFMTTDRVNKRISFLQNRNEL